MAATPFINPALQLRAFSCGIMTREVALAKWITDRILHQHCSGESTPECFESHTGSIIVTLGKGDELRQLEVDRCVPIHSTYQEIWQMCLMAVHDQPEPKRETDP